MDIKPFAEPSPFLEKKGFKILSFDLDLVDNFWMRLHVKWDIPEESHKVKYPKFEGEIITCGVSSEVNFSFPEFGKGYDKKLKFSYDRATLNLGIQRVSKGSSFPFRYRFHDNTKYGANIYFVSQKWNSGPDKLALYKFTHEEDEELVKLNEVPKSVTRLK